MDNVAHNGTPITEVLGATTQPLDAKRDAQAPQGLEHWHPYYAGFSEPFDRSVLQDMGIENGAIVLDPWNGSGTTSLVASALGGKSIGVDLNPFASLIAAAKHISPDDAEAAATTAGSS